MRIRDSEKWLARVFAATSPEALVRNYDKWADTYDSDMSSLGYLNPAVVASLVSRHVKPHGDPMLDAGVGTGILGEVLHAVGYRNLTGIDISEGMLARARLKGFYRELRKGFLGQALEFADASFAAIVSTGVFTTGHATPASLDELLRVTRPGGYLIFTVGNWAYEQGGFKKKQRQLESAQRWQAVDATGPYRPMPQVAPLVAPLADKLTTRCFVYKVN
jgi:predicted TPR repeat methyltransferase